jgi:hypothetical protein
MAASAAAFVLTAGCSTSAIGGQETLNQVDKAKAVAVQATLRNVAVAQTTYLALNGAYATDVEALHAQGLNVSADVALEVVTADATTYCAQGSAAGAGSWHVSDAQSAALKGPCQAP